MGLNSADQPVALGGTVAGSIQMAGTAVLAVLVAFYPETFTPAKSLVLGGAFNAIVMVINTIWQRRHAWSPTTVAKVAVQAAETGNAAAAVEAHK